MIGQFLAVALLVAVLLANLRLTLIVLLACIVALIVLGISAMSNGATTAVGAGAAPVPAVSALVEQQPTVV